MATTANHSHGTPAATHGGAHAADTHAADAHGHGGRVDTSGDKAAAFVGLFAGAALLGGLIYGMVTWTNARYAHEGGERAAAEATR